MNKVIAIKYFCVIFPLILVLNISHTYAQETNLDALLKEVRQSKYLINKDNKAREQRFRAEHSQRKKRLLQVKKELQQALVDSRRLKDTLQNNDQLLAEIDEQILKNSSNLGELFGVVRQISGETHAVFKNSIISIQYPERSKFLKRLSDSRTLPAINDLKRLWYEMQRQMTESGKNVQFKHMIITAQGNEEQRLITRIGEFNSLSQNTYLQYLNKTSQLVELKRQPPQHFLAMIGQLETAAAAHEKGEIALAIDPSGGTLLSLMTQIPSIEERVRQGGIIGYIILFIGLLSVLIALERYIYLSLISYKINKQRKIAKASEKNPLGRIMHLYHQIREGDKQLISVETLSLKLDELILSETPKIEKGLVMLGLFATVTPLLGLLGTVIGMIETFQSIALFGTGDPKLMSGGISQALVTTGLGLIVAIPAILLHGFLQTKSNRLIQVLDEESAGYVAQIAEQIDLKESSDPKSDNALTLPL